jgi:hypothetical protein
MADHRADVRIPAAAVGPEDVDVSKPTVQLLRDLSLLPEEGDREKASGFKTAFTGPPDSVAIIEAGATAIAKAWALVLGGAAGGLWVAVRGFWGDNPDQRSTLLWVAGIASAAIILAIGYIISSDVRGRAAATVATCEARARISVAMLEAARHAHDTIEPAHVDTVERVLPLPAPLKAKNSRAAGSDEADWIALAVRSLNGNSEYLLVKGTRHAWVKTEDVAIAKP